jgi:hypothetical protein
MKGAKTGGGSRKGKPNRAKVEFREQLQQYCDDKGVNPFFLMVDLIADPMLEDMELAQYLQPRLRAIELSGNPDAPLLFERYCHSLRDALDCAYKSRPGVVQTARVYSVNGHGH